MCLCVYMSKMLFYVVVFTNSGAVFGPVEYRMARPHVLHPFLLHKVTKKLGKGGKKGPWKER